MGASSPLHRIPTWLLMAIGAFLFVLAVGVLALLYRDLPEYAQPPAIQKRFAKEIEYLGQLALNYPVDEDRMKELEGDFISIEFSGERHSENGAMAKEQPEEAGGPEEKVNAGKKGSPEERESSRGIKILNEAGIAREGNKPEEIIYMEKTKNNDEPVSGKNERERSSELEAAKFKKNKEIQRMLRMIEQDKEWWNQVDKTHSLFKDPAIVGASIYIHYSKKSTSRVTIKGYEDTEESWLQSLMGSLSSVMTHLDVNQPRVRRYSGGGRFLAIYENLILDPLGKKKGYRMVFDLNRLKKEISSQED